MTTEPCANAIERDPSYADDNLIWIDMEMTGLQPEVNRVLEVAAIITDKNLNILHESFWFPPIFRRTPMPSSSKSRTT